MVVVRWSEKGYEREREQWLTPTKNNIYLWVREYLYSSAMYVQ